MKRDELNKNLNEDHIQKARKTLEYVIAKEETIPGFVAQERDKHRKEASFFYRRAKADNDFSAWVRSQLEYLRAELMTDWLSKRSICGN